jgi:hypothetical protein
MKVLREKTPETATKDTPVANGPDMQTDKGTGQATDEQLQYALATELMNVCMSMLSEYGLDTKRLVGNTCQNLALDFRAPTAQMLFQDVLQLSELVNEWAEESPYVDETGRPKTLPINGPDPSFECLVKKYFGQRSIDDVIGLGRRTGALEKLGSDKVEQVSAFVVFAGDTTLVLAHAIYAVRSFLYTAKRNALHDHNFVTFPDRRAATCLDEEDLPDFIAAIRQPTSNLLEMANRWLTARAAVQKPHGPKKRTLVGLHSYVFGDTFLD